VVAPVRAMTETQTDDTDGRTARKPFYTTLKIEPSGDGAIAYEPEADSNLKGRGKTPAEAVEHYAQALQGDSQ